MEPMSDRDLDELLTGWRAPCVPESLERRVLKANSRSWKSWLFRGRIQIPVPVAVIFICIVAVLLGFMARSPRPAGSRIANSGDLQPVKHLEIRIVRSNYETDN